MGGFGGGNRGNNQGGQDNAALVELGVFGGSGWWCTPSASC